MQLPKRARRPISRATSSLTAAFSDAQLPPGDPELAQGYAPDVRVVVRLGPHAAHQRVARRVHAQPAVQLHAGLQGRSSAFSN